MRGRSIFLFFVFLSFCSLLSAEESNPVFQLKISGTIDPAIARYVSRGLEEARKAQAAAVLIELDTPGGLDSSMRAIVQGIMNSAVPVIIYVAPSGARAASSGTFMTLASHVAAMAPGTSIGAAHPVQSSHEYSGPVKDPSVTEQKLTQDAVVYLRSLAEVRGRNVEWAELFVTENRLATDEEAYEKRTVDLIVSDVTDLFNQADGIRVNTVFGPTVLELKNRPRFVLRPSLIENLLHQLAHPNIAYILLLLGAYGLIFELATPGAVFPGVMGAIFLIMSLVALETLEVNWAGVALICLSFIFFLTDIRIPGHGFLTAGGIIIFLVGSAP